MSQHTANIGSAAASSLQWSSTTLSGACMRVANMVGPAPSTSRRRGRGTCHDVLVYFLPSQSKSNACNCVCKVVSVDKPPSADALMVAHTVRCQALPFRLLSSPRIHGGSLRDLEAVLVAPHHQSDCACGRIQELVEVQVNHARAACIKRLERCCCTSEEERKCQELVDAQRPHVHGVKTLEHCPQG